MALPLLDGQWQLNHQLSDSLKKAQADARKSMRPAKRRNGSRSRGGRGSSGRRHGMRPGGRRAAANNMAMVFSQFLPASEQLTIELRANGMDLRYAEGNTRLIHLTTQGQSVSARGKPNQAERTVAIAGWEDDRLYVENTTEQNIKIFEIYFLREDGSQLTIETQNHLSAKRRARVFAEFLIALCS